LDAADNFYRQLTLERNSAMSKGTVIRGTPVHTIRSGGSGINPGKPAGFNTGAETVPDRFEGAQRGNRQVEADNGWPANSLGSTYNSDAGNPGDASRTRLADRYGKNKSGGGPIDMNDPKANGNGIMFDGVKQSLDYLPTTSDVMDSPVPKGAQMPQDDASIKLNEIRNGQGDYWKADDVIEDSLVKADGVMARS
jgi:hypothetical protein